MASEPLAISDSLAERGQLEVGSSFDATPSGGARECSLAGQFNYVAPERKPYPAPVAFMRKYLFKIFLIVVFFGTFLWLLIAYFQIPQSEKTEKLLFLECSLYWKELFKYLSIPCVSVIFTWWHVWLGIKMCFYPVEFHGCFPPVCGWQGIVPRRARIMAERSCDIMLGTLITVEEVIDRIDPEDFFSKLKPVLSRTTANVLGRVASKNWPELWAMLPDWAKEELNKKVLEESQLMFEPVIGTLKTNIHEILDFKAMAVDILCSNKELLVEMFQKIGWREFTFIQHVAAVMGFILGVIQMLLWVLLNSNGDKCTSETSNEFHCWGGFVILPVSGLIIGFFTNWLGITMIFRPVEPHLICGGYVNIQGVFLKRQKNVSEELSKVICKELVNATKMLQYIVKYPATMDRILNIYQEHMTEAINKVIGKAKIALPVFVGPGAMDRIKDDVVQETIVELQLPENKVVIEEYMDGAFDLPDTLKHRLSRLHPIRFEGMLHPVFQEDEWMVLTLGGVLGVLVGSLQAFALGS